MFNYNLSLITQQTNKIYYIKTYVKEQAGVGKTQYNSRYCIIFNFSMMLIQAMNGSRYTYRVLVASTGCDGSGRHNNYRRRLNISYDMRP